jgi:hypothetical protein
MPPSSCHSVSSTPAERSRSRALRTSPASPSWKPKWKARVSPGIRPSRQPPRSRWTSFLADSASETPRVLYERGNPAHRLRVEHNRSTLLVHLSDEDGSGWTVLAIDRPTRRWAIAQRRRQAEAAEDAFRALYPGG